MAIKYVGNALSKASDGKLKWFREVLVPVPSVDKIPKNIPYTATVVLQDGTNVQSSLEIGPPKIGNVSINGLPMPTPGEIEFEPFPWEIVELSNFQMDLYFNLKNNISFSQDQPSYQTYSSNQNYQMQNVDAIEYYNENSNLLKIEKLYLGGSLEFVRHCNANGKFISFREEIGDIEKPGNIFSPFNVWYAVGSLLTKNEVSKREKEEARRSAIQNARENANTEIMKPIALSIKKEKEDFKKAVVEGENISLTEDGRYLEGIFPRVKFIFDNGEERYAEVLEIIREPDILIQSNVTEESIASLGNSLDPTSLQPGVDMSNLINQSNMTDAIIQSNVTEERIASLGNSLDPTSLQPGIDVSNLVNQSNMTDAIGTPGTSGGASTMTTLVSTTTQTSTNQQSQENLLIGQFTTPKQTTSTPIPKRGRIF